MIPIAPDRSRRSPLLVALPTLALATLALATAVRTQTCVPAPPGLVAWWPGSGNAADIAGSHNGVLQNGTAFAQGLVGQAFSFDGNDDGIEVPDSPGFDMTDFTLSAWIRTSDAGSGRRRIVSQQVCPGGGLPDRFWVLSLFNNRLEICSRSSDGVADLGATCVGYGAVELNDSQFHHVAVTRKAGVAVEFYIDGDMVQSQAISNTGSFTLDAPVYIGRLDPAVQACFGVGSEAFSGSIDEVAVFNRALHEWEVKGMFDAHSSGMCPPGVAAYRQFGMGCPGSSGTPTLDHAPGSLPRLNNNFAIDLGSLPPGNPSAFVAFGFSIDDWLGIPLPADLTPFGLWGCTVYISVDVAFPSPTGGGTGQLSISIPNDPSLMGLSFFNQALVLDPAINPAGGVVTNAGQGVIGT